MTSVVGTASDTTGSSGWTNPNNVFTSNNSYAVSASITDGGLTGFIYALGHGFSVPTGATIDGLSIAVEGKNQLSGSGFRIRHNNTDIYLRNGGADISPTSPSGVSTTSWSGSTDTTKTIGSSTASWSASLTPTIVNSSSFGVRFKMQNLNATAQTFSIDSIIITVYYTYAGSSFSSQQLFQCEG